MTALESTPTGWWKKGTLTPPTSMECLSVNVRGASAATRKSSSATLTASSGRYPTPQCSSPSSIDLTTAGLDLWSLENEKVVTSPYDYVASRPGKELRSMLIACFNEWLELPHERLATIDQVVGMLHTASLLIDDIQDGSSLRRGRAAAHKIFGEALTINSANYIYFLALQQLGALHNPKTIDIFTTEVLALHRGQAMDLHWRDTLTCPSEEEYFRMVANKTGGLFRLAYKLMRAESTVDVDLLPIVDSIGVLFQVVDDYKNLTSKEYGSLKGVGEDLTEGKFSFPVIRTIRADPKDVKLLHILQQKPTDEAVKQEGIDIMREKGSLEYTEELIRALVRQVRGAIESMDEGRGRGNMMLQLIEKITKID